MVRAHIDDGSQTRSTSRWWRLCLPLLLVILGACKTDVDVVVDVEEDGSGQVAVTVTFDREAADALLDLDGDEGLRLDDLFQAGWEIVPPEVADDGSVRTTAIKRFGTTAQFTEVMDEISGEGSLFRDFLLTRQKDFATVDYSVTGTISPEGLEAFADPAVEAVLGRTLLDVSSDAGATGEDVTVSLAVRLPGTVAEERSNGQTDLAADDAVRRWEVSLDDESSDVVMQSATNEVEPLVWRGIAVVAAILTVLVAFGHLLRLLRPERRRGRPKPKSKPKPKAKPKPEVDASFDDSESVDDDQAADTPNVVALDGMGVLYREGDDINRILVPFVRERGSEVTHDEIVAKARLISLGRITPSEFWRAVGVEGDPNEIDNDYLGRFQLNPGVVKFLRSLRDRGVRVACITNDSTAWANKLRVRHSLDGLIDPWVVSGAVGVRKPDQPIYEVLRRVTNEAPNAIMVVDDNIENLDAAKALGFRTAWFSPEGSVDEAGGHAILRSFEVVDEDETVEA